MGTQQTIELNGKHYDTRTGKLVSVNAPSKSESHPHTASKGGSVDGLKKSHPARKTHAQSARRSVQKSSTLKRSVVKKPVHAKKADKTTSHAHSKQITSTENLVAHDPSLKTPPAVPASRLQRVKNIKKSNLVSRFPTHPSSSNHHKHQSKQHASHKRPTNVVQAVSSVVETTTDQFASAIHNANSHDQPKPKKPAARHRLANKLGIKSKTLNVASFAVAAFLLVGFFGYQSAPNLSMRVASMRADVEGSLPAYMPNGFSLNRQIQYKPGQIVVAYNSNSDSRQFSIVQTASKWDSETLHQNFVAKQKEVRTIQEKGKTIYLYDESNATWVDGGIWFKIEGDSKLNSEQLSRLASSL